MRTHAIVSTKTELRRTDLEFGPRWITHTPTGNLYWEFGGDVGYPSDSHHYYVRQDGTLVVLQSADPPNRAEMEARQARKEERRAERDAATIPLHKMDLNGWNIVRQALVTEVTVTSPTHEPRDSGAKVLTLRPTEEKPKPNTSHAGVLRQPDPAGEVFYGGPIIRRNIGTVLAVNGVPVAAR